MTDDLETIRQKALLREVDEEVRNDELKALWKKYRFYVISLVFLAILGAFAFEGFKYYKHEISVNDSLLYSRAIDAIQSKDFASAEKDLSTIINNNKTGYAELASLKTVFLLEQQNQKSEARTLLNEIRNRADFSVPTRNIATISLAYRMLDDSNPDIPKIKEMLAPFSSKGSSWHTIAQELLDCIS